MTDKPAKCRECKHVITHFAGEPMKQGVCFYPQLEGRLLWNLDTVPDWCPLRKGKGDA